MSNHRIYQNISISDKFNKQLSLDAQVLYLMLFAQVDDFGVMLAAPDDIKAIVAPKNRHLTVKKLIKSEIELLEAGLAIFYSYDNKTYLQILNFNKYQVFGKDYNRNSKYPPYVEREHSRVERVFGLIGEDKYTLLTHASTLLQMLTPTSYSISISNSNSSYKIDKLDELNLEGKEVLKCFYSIGYFLRELEGDKDIESWNKWIVELQNDYKNKDILSNAKRWRDYWEKDPPHNFKTSFRNWVSKDFAVKKESTGKDYVDRGSEAFQKMFKNAPKRPNSND